MYFSDHPLLDSALKTCLKKRKKARDLGEDGEKEKEKEKKENDMGKEKAISMDLIDVKAEKEKKLAVLDDGREKVKEK